MNKKVAKKVAKKTARKSAKETDAEQLIAKKTAKKTTGKSAKKTNVEQLTVKEVAAKKTAGEKEKFLPYKAKNSQEEYMNGAQTEHFRNILTAWRTELTEEINKTIHHMRDGSSHLSDINDRATQEEGLSLELRKRDRERQLIKKIDESIGMLDSGDYGFCKICGMEIGIRRLEARATASQCIDCKTLGEMKEHHLN